MVFHSLTKAVKSRVPVVTVLTGPKILTMIYGTTSNFVVYLLYVFLTDLDRSFEKPIQKTDLSG